MEIDQLVGGMGGVGTKKWEGGVGGFRFNTTTISIFLHYLKS